MPGRRAVPPGSGRLHGSASVTRGQAVRGWQTLISAGAVRVTRGIDLISYSRHLPRGTRCLSYRLPVLSDGQERLGGG